MHRRPSQLSLAAVRRARRRAITRFTPGENRDHCAAPPRAPQPKEDKFGSIEAADAAAQRKIHIACHAILDVSCNFVSGRLSPDIHYLMRFTDGAKRRCRDDHAGERIHAYPEIQIDNWHPAPRSVVAAEIDLAEGSPSSATCSVRRLAVGCYVGGGGEIGGVPPWRIGSACPLPRHSHSSSINCK